MLRKNGLPHKAVLLLPWFLFCVIVSPPGDKIVPRANGILIHEEFVSKWQLKRNICFFAKTVNTRSGQSCERKRLIWTNETCVFVTELELFMLVVSKGQNKTY